MKTITKIVKIKKKQWYNKDIFGLEVYAPKIDPQPGQFFQLRASASLDPFLNRPISVASYSGGRVLFITKVVGRGTHLLSQKQAGDELVMLGPFGNEVKVPRKSCLLVAGGIGMAPLYFLAQKLHRAHVRSTFLYGARTPGDIILKSSIKEIAHKAIFVTERGTKKHMTAVQAVSECDLREYEVAFACGPKQMLIELQQLRLPVPVYAFCEDFLGCGCGLCLGCAVLHDGTYKRICTDGPVFELSGIDFNA
jgi:dihydroorotate dehydrogenase electron transfer subunit